MFNPWDLVLYQRRNMAGHKEMETGRNNQEDIDMRSRNGHNNREIRR